MKVYLVRHGESNPEGPDDERQLNEKGQHDIKRLAHFLKNLNIQVSQLLHSRKHRALQTAEILREGVKITGEMSSRLELDPSAPVDPMIGEIEISQGDMLLVSHLPYLLKLVGMMVANNDYANFVHFEPGSMVCLEKMAVGHWVVSWMISPEILKG